MVDFTSKTKYGLGRHIKAMVGDEQPAHSPFGASKAERWLECPGSIALCEKAPPPEESAYAAEGTEAHGVLEKMLKRASDVYMVVPELRLKHSPEMIEHALECFWWVSEKLVSAPGAELLCETRVDASPFTCEGQFGTVDAAIVEHFGRLVVIDFKYGAGVAVDIVSEDGKPNAQLVYYALGISHRYDHNFQDVEIVVMQPRAYHESGNTVRSHVMSMAELLAWGDVFRAGVKRAQAEGAPLKAGKWCRFCPAGVICPELKGSAMQKAGIKWSDELGLRAVPEPVAVPNLGVALEACDRLEAWIGKVRSHARGVLERGGSVPGFKLVAKRAQRKWANEAAVSKEAKERFGDDAFSQPKLLSPAQLKERKKHSKGIDGWVAARVTAESSGTVLVPDTDKRVSADARSLADIFGKPGSVTKVIDAEVTRPVQTSLPFYIKGRRKKSKKKNTVWSP